MIMNLQHYTIAKKKTEEGKNKDLLIQMPRGNNDRAGREKTPVAPDITPGRPPIIEIANSIRKVP
jgi:hypothetical protein